ncbi:FAD binding domain-containing protein [Lichenifustis flavocetrariae]|uniref:FAD binding domain-containing protein n=1 Tax=Lichenifustis flavocetrariae TaxID=2949735 RepID=A0AA41Z303_9HYPH|nr:FAD binding domain-containing protein [Lichenifustis flavocetrariae]MCW6509415.1 FAD binding domain-containing protein [Lichenifustis flavocetrariae]
MPVSVKTYAGVEEAARALSASRSARFFGGGTLVMRALNEGTQAFDTVIRVTDPALRQVKPEGDRLTIGAGVTMAAVLANRDLAFLHPVARSIGGPAVRTMATIGGNLFAACPYGDFTVALLALDGAVTIAGGGRALNLDDFLKVRDREPRVIVTSVTITRPRDAQAFRFHKVSRIKPKGISVLSIAAHLPQSGGRVNNARVAYGAMGPTPLRVTGVERALEGRSLDASGIAPALAAATERLDPPTDALASSWYRREVAPVHLRRLLLNQAG